ncbi:PTS fructose transporter subunit EIIBC [Agarivorans sp. B2Z047]|uniref:fructose-specific PTS transporter subunit EIIC n=1 Tax=Agarivorans sp. B2Z047 TaxID=2652721 RepID=UPI00128B23FC|nr:fructose-specific PTS transporter subunit EIIC [Agarivorans sp. B2Z047]MPW31846.1 PTS fructose transporter subunit EIIBC [Agarivorans sp. B2Z047]UQN43693.1 fructose-specific PTS transporter subunit EIIC [Agarivorans sp. B2Z047]
MNIVSLTASLEGVANSTIAEAMLEQAAKDKGWSLHSECHSTLQAVQSLSSEQISQAELVLVVAEPAAFSLLELQRFDGKAVYFAQFEQVMESAERLLEKTVAEAQPFNYTALDLSVQRGEASSLKVVGITACPTGVAHTFMAAEALQETGEALGYQVKIETRGSVGAKNTLTEQDIAQADLVIVAADIEVDLARFDGKKLFKTSTGHALKKTKECYQQALDQAKDYQHHSSSSSNSNAGATSSTEKTGAYKHLMTGVSHMLPLVIAGGLAIALSFVFGIEAFKEEGTLAAALMSIGGASAFALMIPVLSGYIAYSIADRPGLAPGLVGGMLASSTGAGFLGGILSGFLAGYLAKWLLDNIKLPSSMEALKPILIVPFLATLVCGLIMIYIVGEPVSTVMVALTGFLNNMGATNAILLGVLLGSMMCFDLGGPVNKAAYTFGVGLLSAQTYAPMAAVMAAGMVPALGMGIATWVARNKFEQSESEAGKASFVLGLCFISEGAIPFAAKDPLRVIPACMAGGAFTGAMSMYIGAELLAPHGGIFVLFIPNAITPVLTYVLAIALGSLITGMSYAALKRRPEMVMANG